MKVKVLQSFRDKDNFAKAYSAGEVIEIDENRAEHLISINIVEKIVIKSKKQANDN